MTRTCSTLAPDPTEYHVGSECLSGKGNLLGNDLAQILLDEMRKSNPNMVLEDVFTLLNDLFLSMEAKAGANVYIYGIGALNAKEREEEHLPAGRKASHKRPDGEPCGVTPPTVLPPNARLAADFQFAPDPTAAATKAARHAATIGDHTYDPPTLPSLVMADVPAEEREYRAWVEQAWFDNGLKEWIDQTAATITDVTRRPPLARRALSHVSPPLPRDEPTDPTNSSGMWVCAAGATREAGTVEADIADEWALMQREAADRKETVAAEDGVGASLPTPEPMGTKRKRDDSGSGASGQ